MKKIILFAFLALISQQIFAQQLSTVKGTVIASDTGLPIIGANVVNYYCPTEGTITDFDGNFTLTSDIGISEIQVSYIGYETQVLRASAIPMKITLRPDTMMLNADNDNYPAENKQDNTQIKAIIPES